MTRKGKIDFCLESAQEIEGLDSEEMTKYLTELNGLSDDELDVQVEWWDYLWDK